jgi:hypothetical protein
VVFWAVRLERGRDSKNHARRGRESSVLAHSHLTNHAISPAYAHAPFRQLSADLFGAELDVQTRFHFGSHLSGDNFPSRSLSPETELREPVGLFGTVSGLPAVTGKLLAHGALAEADRDGCLGGSAFP